MKKILEVAREISLGALSVVVLVLFISIAEKYLCEDLHTLYGIGIMALNIYFGIRIALVGHS